MSAWPHDPAPTPHRRQLGGDPERAGFVVVRTRGGHRFLQHPDGRTTVVPVHAGETIDPGLATKILRDCELTAEQLEQFL